MFVNKEINYTFYFFCDVWSILWSKLFSLCLLFFLFLVSVCVKLYIAFVSVPKQKGVNGCAAFKLLFVNGFLHF